MAVGHGERASTSSAIAATLPFVEAADDAYPWQSATGSVLLPLQPKAIRLDVQTNNAAAVVRSPLVRAGGRVGGPLESHYEKGGSRLHETA